MTLQRQVVLEVKILEVTLDEGFRSGIDASLLAIASNFDGVIRLLEAQGNVKVISSPRITTLNNQKAVFKVGDVEYFSTDQSTVTTTGGNSTVQNTNVSLQPFFSGIALDVTPQISENGDIILHIHPLLNSVEADLETIDGKILTLPKSDTRESDSIARAQRRSHCHFGLDAGQGTWR